jgi:hypothetical protein
MNMFSLLLSMAVRDEFEEKLQLNALNAPNAQKVPKVVIADSDNDISL